MIVDAPHLIDAEVVSALRRLASAHTVSDGAAHDALRANVAPYDATNVALAEALDCTLVTGDTRLSRAPGIACTVAAVPD